MNTIDQAAIIRQRFEQAHSQLCAGADRFMSVILGCTALAAIGFAFATKPVAWNGSEPSASAHIIAAVVLGGLAVAPGIILTLRAAGTNASRFAIAAGLGIMASLLIHFGGGRVEMHFGIFVLLAMLAVYRDIRVPLIMAGIVAADHVVRGLMWPESIFGASTAGFMRVVEHALYVVVEVGALYYLATMMRADLRSSVTREIEAEQQRAELEQAVSEMSGELATIQNTNDFGRSVNTPADDRLGELATAINHVLASMSNLASEVSTSTGACVDAAGRMAAASEQMSVSVGSVGDVMSQTRDLAEGSAGRAEEGGRVIRTSIQGLRSIADAVNVGADQVESLTALCDEVGTSVQMIDDISDQTNLLALNAAIEAARAGEHGRGFAVVADEVRKLAERTTQVTAQVAESVQGIARQSAAAAQQMRTTRDQTETAVQTSSEAGESLDRIVADTGSITQRITEVATSISEMNTAAQQLVDDTNSVRSNALNLEQAIENVRH